MLGSFVEVVPLARVHAPDLFVAAARPDIWRHMPIRGFSDLAAVERWIDAARYAAEGGREEPFAIIDRASGRAIGSTRYLDVRFEERALEIGWTWLAGPFQRTSANTETKYLLLRQAFEERDVLRVAFFTDAQNGRSRAALVRLGATYEGTLRYHRARAVNGFSRDSAAYSIIAPEWPALRTRLESKLRRHARAYAPSTGSG